MLKTYLTVDEVADVARAEHCYSTANRLILGAVLELHAASKPVDPVAVAGPPAATAGTSSV